MCLAYDDFFKFPWKQNIVCQDALKALQQAVIKEQTATIMAYYKCVMYK